VVVGGGGVSDDDGVVVVLSSCLYLGECRMVQLIIAVVVHAVGSSSTMVVAGVNDTSVRQRIEGMEQRGRKLLLLVLRSVVVTTPPPLLVATDTDS
jgi:hypothetical protein